MGKNFEFLSDVQTSTPQSILSGNVLQTLMANNMNPRSLRTNAMLPHDAWLAIDKAVIKVAGQRLNGIADLAAHGLIRDIPGGLGAKYDFWQTVSDDLTAQQSMQGITAGAETALDFGENQIPIPITHVDFRLGARELAAAQRDGRNLDTTYIEVAVRKVVEKLEDMLFNGSSVVAGGNSLPGYFNYTNSNEVGLTGGWTTTPANIEKDVVKLISASEADRNYGPWILYLHTDEWADMRMRDSTAGGINYLDILKGMAGIIDVKPSDAISNGGIAMVQMTSDVISLAKAVDIQVVQWDSHGGLQTNFKVLAAMAPRCMADYSGRCGIAYDDNMS